MAALRVRPSAEPAVLFTLSRFLPAPDHAADGGAPACAPSLAHVCARRGDSPLSDFLLLLASPPPCSAGLPSFARRSLSFLTPAPPLLPPPLSFAGRTSLPAPPPTTAHPILSTPDWPAGRPLGLFQRLGGRPFLPSSTQTTQNTHPNTPACVFRSSSGCRPGSKRRLADCAPPAATPSSGLLAWRLIAWKQNSKKQRPPLLLAVPIPFSPLPSLASLSVPTSFLIGLVLLPHIQALASSYTHTYS